MDAERGVTILIDDALETFQECGANGQVLSTFSKTVVQRLMDVFADNNTKRQAMIILAVDKLCALFSYYEYDTGAHHYGIDGVITELGAVIGNDPAENDLSRCFTSFKLLSTLVSFAHFPNVAEKEKCIELVRQLRVKLDNETNENPAEYLVAVQKIKDQVVSAKEELKLMIKANITEKEKEDLEKEARKDYYRDCYREEEEKEESQHKRQRERDRLQTERRERRERADRRGHSKSLSRSSRRHRSNRE